MRSGLTRKIIQARTKQGLQSRTYWVRADEGQANLRISSGQQLRQTRTTPVTDVKGHIRFSPGIIFAKETNQGVHDAINSINKVHRIPTNLLRVPVSVTFGLNGAAGTYYPWGSHSKIEIARGSAMPRSAMAHEYGHYLDHHLFGSGGKGGIGVNSLGTHQNSPELKPLMRALARSKAVQSLMERRRKAIRENDWQGEHVTNYLCMRAEIFARAYNQWIAHKSGNIRMQNETRNMGESWARYSYRGVQWEQRDFVHISREFDNLFRNRGLLR